MSVVFLIGGTGNQLFAYAASHPRDTFSLFFLRRPVRRILGWTSHEQVLRYPGPGPVGHGLAFLALCLDIPLAALTGKSLFSTLDTRKIKARPMMFECARMGYFQQAEERRDVAELAAQIAPVSKPGRIVLHVRGGDLLALERVGQNAYGILDGRYYRAGITRALSDLAHRGQPATGLLVLTDDPDHAGTLDLAVDGAPAPDIRACPLGETLSLAVGADWFVSSNSTLSYWVLRLRQGRRSVAPQPFQRRGDYPLPETCLRVPMDTEA